MLLRRTMIQDVSRSAMTVRTRHLIWSSMFTEILQTILLVRQKDFVDTFAADHLEIGYKFRPKKALIVTDERYLIFLLILSCTEIPNTISSNNIGLDKVLVHTHPSGVFPQVQTHRPRVIRFDIISMFHNVCRIYLY